MSSVIWKWSLLVTDQQPLLIPKGAQFLSVQKQGREINLWALCDPAAQTEERFIGIYGTGNPIPYDPGTFLGTFQLAGGDLVFHVFVLEKT